MAHRSKFVPNEDFENDPRPKHVIWKYVQKGQVWISPSGVDPKGNHELRCRLCGHWWVGNQTKATLHFNTTCEHARCPHACVYILRELQRARVPLKGSLPVYVREAHREGELDFEHPLNWRLPGGVARQPPLVPARDLAQGRGRAYREGPAPVVRQDGARPFEGVGASGAVGTTGGGGEGAGEVPSGVEGAGEGSRGAGEGPSGVEGVGDEKERAEHARARQLIWWGRGRMVLHICSQGGDGRLGASLYRIEDMFGRERTGAGLYLRWRELILEIGAQHVVAICMDNALANKEAYRLLRNDQDLSLRKIAWIPCAAHCCNLMLTHIARQPWVAQVVGEGRDITLFFRRHARAAYLLSRQSPPVSLIRLRETRYGTNLIMLRRMLDLHLFLDACVSSSAWATTAWLPALRYGARRCFDLLRDPKWWQQVDLVATIMGPIHELLQHVDSDGRRVGDVWGLLERLQITVDRRSLDEACHQPIKKIVKERSDMLLTPIHCAPYLLHFKYRSIDSLMRGMVEERILHLDYIASQIAGGRKGDEMTVVWSSSQDFHGKYPTPGHWGGPVGDAKIEQPDFDPVRWWRVQEGDHRVLRDVAMRCLGAWTTASPCKRNWSTHDFVYTKRRNREGVEQLEKFVFYHWNLKLLQSSHSRGGFIGAGLPGVGVTDVERRDEDYSRFEPDVMALGTYDSAEIEREADRLRRQSSGRRLAPTAAALAHKIRQQGEDAIRGEDVIDDDVSWLSGPYRGDGFLDVEAPATVSPAGRMLPPRTSLRGDDFPGDEAPFAGTPACEADSHSLRGDKFPDVSADAGPDDGMGGGGRRLQVDASTATPHESHQPREPATRSSTLTALEDTLQPSSATGFVEGTSSESPTAAAATFSSPHRAVEYDSEGRLRRRAGFTGQLDLWPASAVCHDVERDFAAYLPRPLSDLPRVAPDAETGVGANTLIRVSALVFAGDRKQFWFKV
ncbi:hypothetical protein CBR_g52272 [Chara braunii]|uniref:DUF659 domain-containing protein n=1 Tax=Chara braunii TaxID=69332 RepID=A0A388MA41_CHABU|nr:hypothetical protein CBR_g52272 [Chara braunii]|eukprot:GBG91385.1 hypothetical protein CBR_g52272 [Chara braunii]